MGQDRPRKGVPALGRRMSRAHHYNRLVLRVDVFVDLLKNFGFPVACVAALFIALQRERDDHKAETAALTNAISELRVVLGKILTKLGGD